MPHEEIEEQVPPEEWVELLTSKERLDRLEAARHLADAEDPQLADTLASALSKEKDCEVKVELGVALGLLNDPRALDGLMAILENRRPTDLTALALLGRLGSAACIPKLHKALNRHFLHPLVKVRLLATMARLSDRDSLQKLLSLSRGKRFEMRCFALELLGELAGTQKEAANRLVQAVEDSAEPMRECAVRGLVIWGSEEALCALQKVAPPQPDPHSDFDETLQEAMEQIQAAQGQKENGTG